MSMFNDISCERYDNKDGCLKNAEFVKTFAKRFGIGQWSFIGPSSEKKWYQKKFPTRRQHHQILQGSCGYLVLLFRKLHVFAYMPMSM